MLTCHQISKSFGNLSVLKSVNLKVEPRKITVLIGPSGSGKTTLIKTLSLLELPDYGTVTIDNESYEFPLRNNRKINPPWPTVTVVFQGLFLWPHMTLRQNIEFALNNSKDRNINAELMEYSNLFKMSDFIDRFPNETSVGQRQRAAIIRALMLNPNYILLDEITSALDVEQVSTVLSCLQSLKERNIGILIVTHLLGFASRAADYVAFIDDGQILEAGNVGLLENPKHERVKKFLSVIQSAS